MARRYSGDVTVYLAFDDATDRYRGRVVARPYVTGESFVWRFDGLNLSPHDRSRLAVDSPEAFDRAAEAAIGFAIGLSSTEPDAPARDVAEAISMAVNYSADACEAVIERSAERVKARVATMREGA